MINTCFTVTGIMALALSGIFLAGIDFFSPRTSFVTDDPWFILAFIVYAFCWPVSGLLDRVFIASRRAEFSLIKNTIFSLLKIPLPIFLGLFFHAFGIVSSWGLAIAIAFGIAVLVFLPRVQRGYRPALTIDLGIIRRIRGYAAGNYAVAIFGAAPALLLPIIVVNLVSAEANAYFYISWTMAGLLHAIPIAVSFSLFAEASHFEDQLASQARRAFRFSVLLLVPAVVLMALLGKWLLLAFGQAYSSNALTLLWLFAASSLPAAINDIYVSVLRVRGRIKELVAFRAAIAFSVLVASAVAGELATGRTAMLTIGWAWLGANALAAGYVILVVRLRARAARVRRSERAV